MVNVLGPVTELTPYRKITILTSGFTTVTLQIKEGSMIIKNRVFMELVITE